MLKEKSTCEILPEFSAQSNITYIGGNEVTELNILALIIPVTGFYLDFGFFCFVLSYLGFLNYLLIMSLFHQIS